MAPIGYVLEKRDRNGNYMVRSVDLDRPTVLGDSHHKSWEKGDEIDFTVTETLSKSKIYLSSQGHYRNLTREERHVRRERVHISEGSDEDLFLDIGGVFF